MPAVMMMGDGAVLVSPFLVRSTINRYRAERGLIGAGASPLGKEPDVGEQRRFQLGACPEADKLGL
jgi:hypothetical protein